MCSFSNSYQQEKCEHLYSSFENNESVYVHLFMILFSETNWHKSLIKGFRSYNNWAQCLFNVNAIFPCDAITFSIEKKATTTQRLQNQKSSVFLTLFIILLFCHVFLPYFCIIDIFGIFSVHIFVIIYHLHFHSFCPIFHLFSFPLLHNSLYSCIF